MHQYTENVEYVHRKTRNPFKVLHALWRLIKNLQDLKAGMILEDVYSHSPLFSKLANWSGVAERVIPDHLRQLPIDQWPRLKRLDLERLLTDCPPGSLGYVVSTHMKALQLNPDLFPPARVTTEQEYVIAHLTETHDIWHVVTGLGNDEPGEVGAVVFSLAQTGASIWLVLLIIGLFNTLIFQPNLLAERFEGISRGWEIGRHAKSLFGIDWTQYWHRPIEDVRRELDLPVHVELGQGIVAETPAKAA